MTHKPPYVRERTSPYWQQLFAAERSILNYAFAHAGPNGGPTRSVSECAGVLRVTRQFLTHRIKALGLDHLVDHRPPRPKPEPEPAPALEPLDVDEGAT